jgi:hypothetical protein
VRLKESEAFGTFGLVWHWGVIIRDWNLGLSFFFNSDFTLGFCFLHWVQLLDCRD